MKCLSKQHFWILFSDRKKTLFGWIEIVIIKIQYIRVPNCSISIFLNACYIHTSAYDLMWSMHNLSVQVFFNLFSFEILNLRKNDKKFEFRSWHADNNSRKMRILKKCLCEMFCHFLFCQFTSQNKEWK